MVVGVYHAYDSGRETVLNSGGLCFHMTITCLRELNDGIIRFCCESFVKFGTKVYVDSRMN